VKFVTAATDGLPAGRVEFTSKLKLKISNAFENAVVGVLFSQKMEPAT